MRRWYFWVLAPVMLVSAAIVGFLTEPPTMLGRVVAYAFAVGLVLATLGLADTRRFGWALRCVAGMIFLTTLSYVGSESWAFAHGKPFGFWGRRSSTNLFNALMAFAIFGIPAIRFVLAGRSGSVADAIATRSDKAEEVDEDESEPEA